MSRSKIDTFEKYIKAMNNILIYVCAGVLLAMLLLGIADVMGRYLFNRAIVGTLEIFEIMMPALVLLSLAYTQQVKAHVTVDILCSHLPPRLRTIVAFLTTCWAIVLFAVIAWQGIAVAITYHQMNSIITNIHVPMILPRLLVPVGAVAICLVLLVDVLHLANDIMRKE
ncbi:MAG: TRAP transporter small permease [Deltaproteobacteria bacterium]|nr:TRAP transporter small permease [Deltaproteobacteria bacterium]